MESKKNFQDIILNAPKQLTSDPEFINHLNISHRQFNKILLCGLGGSALAGEIFFTLKNKNFSPFNINLPFFIHRSYDLPQDTDERTLVIIVSYSGNTEETISAYESAKKKDLEIAGIVSNGKLADLFTQDGTPWVKIPDPNLPPRCSLGYQLVALVKIMMAYGILPPYSQKELSETANKIIPEKLETTAQQIAEKIAGKIPLIYASEENRALARIWKIKINENAKTPSFWNVFPELNHNEMVGWSKKYNYLPFVFLFLIDDNDFPRIKKRQELTFNLLKEEGWPTEKIILYGENPLEKIFWALTLSDWVSYFLALKFNIDPAPVDIVEKFKKLL